MCQSSSTWLAAAVPVFMMLLASDLAAQPGPETNRCLTREQLNIEPIFSACPPLIDEASVSDSSFVARLNIKGGPSRYVMRWRGQNYFSEDIFTYNEATGLYDGFCGIRACSIGPGGWVQTEHWSWLVGTLLAENVGTWTYEELHDDEVFQSRTFEVRELDLAAISGAGQLGIVDQNLPRPLVLKLESFEGIGIADEVIGWSIEGPRGARGAAVYGIGSGSETNADGVDAATVRLGSKPGQYTVTLSNRRITAATRPSFTFTAIDDIADANPLQDHPEVEEGIGETGGQRCDSVGNPIALSVGNKFQREIDLLSNGISPIQFVRYHNSLGFISRSFANYWTHTYDRAIELPDDPGFDPVKVVRPDGKKISFSWNGSRYEPSPGVYASLEQTAAGWRFVGTDATIERFDPDGLLVDITDRHGRIQTAVHNVRGELTRIESNTGDSMDFSYDGDGRLATLTDQAGRTWNYRYETLGRLAFVDNPDGTVREYHYEDLRHPYALTGITREDGRRFSWYEYDADGRATASYHAGDANRVDVQYEDNGDRVVVDPLGNATVYQTRIENRRGILEGISGPVCSQGCGQTETQYAYDAALNLSQKVQYGVVTRYGDYDAKGQPGYRVEAAGTAEERRTDYEYDARFLNRVTRLAEPSVFPGESRITTRSYDDHGNLLSETVSGFDPSGVRVSRNVTHTWDGPFGQISETDGSRTDTSDVTTYEYYPNTAEQGADRARLKAVIDPNGIRIRDRIVYSPTGKILSEIRPNGITLKYAYYPGNDRIKSVSQSGGALFNRTQWEYTAVGDVRRIIVDDETGEQIITQLSYDSAGRLWRVESGMMQGQSFTAHQWVRYEFDEAGNIISEIRESRDTPQSDIVTDRVFDAYNRIDTITRGGVIVDLDYNPDGTLAGRTDGNGNMTTYTYDVFRRLTSTRHLGQLMSTMTYDTHGNQLTVTDPNDLPTHYLHDDLGNRIERQSPDSGTTIYGYNDAGQVISQTDAQGQRTQVAYDPAGRVTLIDRQGTDYDVAYVYDECPNGAGRVCAVITGWGHRIDYGWNEVGELADVTTNEGRLRYSYGPAGSLTRIEYPSGRVVLIDSNGGGLPQQIRLRSTGSTDSILVDGIDYSPLGRPVAWRFGNGLETIVTLDSRHRPITIDVPGLWAWQADQYDANDNLLSLTSASTALSYAYDGLDRLNRVASATASIEFGHDGAGNRLWRKTDGVIETASYEPGSNRLTAFGERQFVLDNSGKTVAVTVNGQPAATYRYSEHNRLTEVLDGKTSASLASYRYDALGQRVEKRGPAANRRYLYGPNGELLVEMDGSGNILHEYVYLYGQPIVDLHAPPGAPPPESPVEIVIDDSAASVFGSNWQNKTNEMAIAGSYLQNRKRNDRAVYWYVDQAGFPGGSHDVFVKWLQPDGEGTSTTYRVHATGQPTRRIVIDHAGRSRGEWVLLGNFEFAPADETPAQYVSLSGFDNNYGFEGTFLEADAVKIVPTYLPEGQSQLKFIHGDHLGTPRLVTDESGRVVWTASHLPFGEASIDEDPDADGEKYTLDLRFSGQVYDQESGLHYNHFRTYDPALGRYLSTDPIGLAGGNNPFLYAKGNPVRFVDPLGLLVRGEWIESPRFNLQEAGVDDWEFVSPSFSSWGYLRFIRVHGHASGYINIDVRCTENCDSWEIHDRVSLAAQGSFEIGPNLYGLGAGFITRNPLVTIGANVALGGAALLQAELHFLELARQKAGPLVEALLDHGPTLICLGSFPDDR